MTSECRVNDWTLYTAEFARVGQGWLEHLRLGLLSSINRPELIFPMVYPNKNHQCTFSMRLFTIALT